MSGSGQAMVKPMSDNGEEMVKPLASPHMDTLRTPVYFRCVHLHMHARAYAHVDICTPVRVSIHAQQKPTSVQKYTRTRTNIKACQDGYIRRLSDTPEA